MKPGRYWIKLCLICCLSIWLWGAPASSFAQLNATQTPIYTLEPRSDAAKTLATQANKLYRTQDYKSALAKIQEALDKDPNSYALHKLYVNIQLMLLPPDRVRQEYVDKMAKDPPNPVFPFILAQTRALWLKWNPDTELYEKAGTVAPDSVVGQLALIALYRYYKKDPAKAEEAYKKAISLDPANHQLIADLASYQVEELKKYDEALALYQSLLKQDPKNYTAVIGVMSVKLAKAGSSHAAKAEVQKELETLKTTEPLSRKLLEAVQDGYGMLLNNKAGYEAISKEISEKFPSKEVVPGSMGFSTMIDTGEPYHLIFSGRRYFWAEKLDTITTDQKTPLADRIAQLEALNKENPDDEAFRAHLLDEMFSLYREAKDLAKQEALVEQILAIEPRKVGLLNKLANSLAENPAHFEKALHYNQRALESLEKHAKAKPDAQNDEERQYHLTRSKAAFLETRGTIQLKLEKFAEAEASFQQALASLPSETARYKLAQALEKQGKTTEAGQMYAEVVASESDESSTAQTALDALAKSSSGIDAKTLVAVATEKRISRLREKVMASLVTEPSKDFTLTSFDGKKVNLASLKGKVVMLNFWASW